MGARISIGLPTIAALRAKRLARVGQARKKFGSHYVLYYSVVLRIATRLSRAQNPKDAQCWTEFCDYRAFSTVFKSFRVLSRNGKSVRENYLRAMARGGHSQRLWESRPRREVRECTCLDGETLQIWADFQLLHLKSIYGGNSIVARAGEHAILRKVRAVFTHGDECVEKLTVRFYYVFLLPCGRLRVPPQCDLTDDDHDRITAKCPDFLRRLEHAGIRHPKTSAPATETKDAHSTFRADVVPTTPPLAPVADPVLETHLQELDPGDAGDMATFLDHCPSVTVNQYSPPPSTRTPPRSSSPPNADKRYTLAEFAAECNLDLDDPDLHEMYKEWSKF